MIIARVPFRISFFGGGTDYPTWYRLHGGEVISTTINKYCYVSLRHLPPFFDHNIRLAYSKVEHCRTIDEIQHPAFREIFRHHKVLGGVEAHYDADLPARSGMGSSSAFAVGLLHAVQAFQGRMVSNRELAEQAIYIERTVLGETVGSQDQVAVAHGGLNHIKFHHDDTFTVQPVMLPADLVRRLNGNLMLYFTGTVRTASEIAKTYTESLADKERNMRSLGALVVESFAALRASDLDGFGSLLHEGWMLKRGLSASISTGPVDEIYSAAREAGALGGKLLGAGGGGFMLLYVPLSAQSSVRARLKDLLEVPFSFENGGSRIIHFEREP